MRKMLLPATIVALGSALFAILQMTAATSPLVNVEEKAWAVESMNVLPSSHTPYLVLYGEVSAPERITLTASLTGHVSERPVADGDQVVPNQLLVELDPTDIDPVVERARAEVARLDADLEIERVSFEADRKLLTREQELLANAQRQLERRRSLVQRNLAPRAQLEEDENAISRAEVALLSRQGQLDGHPARLARLEAQRKHAKATLEEVQRDAQRSKARAPFSGLVAEVKVAPGDHVREGEPLLDLIPLDGLEVRALIPRAAVSELLGALSEGKQLRATDNLGREYRLRALSGQGRGAGIEAIFLIEGIDTRLRPGSLVTLSLHLPPVLNSVALPFSTLYGRDQLYRIEHGRLHSMEVQRKGKTLGPDGNPWVVVSSTALAQGQRILTTHLPNAIDGLRVTEVDLVHQDRQEGAAP